MSASLLLGGCGGSGDEDDTSASGDDATTTTALADTIDTEACPPGPWTVAVRAADVVEPDLPVVEDDAREFTDAVAVKTTAGSYTVYLADYPLDPAAFDSWTYEMPVPAAGKMLATLAMTAYNTTEEPPPLEVGDDVPVVSGPDAVDGTRNLSVLLQVGDGLYNTSPAASGQATVTGISDSLLCLDVAYEDLEKDEVVNGEQVPAPVQKRLVGRFRAEVVDLTD